MIKWQKINQRFLEKQLIKIRSLVEERIKQEITKIKLIIENEINTSAINFVQSSHKRIKMPPIKSLLKYPFRSTKIGYNELLKSDKIKDSSLVSTKQSCQSLISSKVLMYNQQFYYIDKESFLLDEGNYLLLGKDQRMIGSLLRLSNKCENKAFCKMIEFILNKISLAQKSISSLQSSFNKF